jgi:hypothetical protein
MTFAYSLQEGPGEDHKPQKQKLPILALIIFFVIASMLAAAGYFRNPQKQSIFIGLYVVGMLFLVLFGWVTSRMSKSMEETAEIDAIAWFLRSTSSQKPEFFKNASQIASSPSGRHYKSRLLDLLMPLLSPLITSHRISDKDLKRQEELEIYVSCLAQLSDFEYDKGSFWRLREDAKRHPKLGDLLHDKLKELENSKCIPGLRSAATETLKNFSLDAEQPDGQSMITLNTIQDKRYNAVDV